jgi:hypothetical protein
MAVIEFLFVFGIGFILLSILVQILVNPKSDKKKDNIVCIRHKWVMDSVDKDLYCEVCRRRPGESNEH